jgi:TM2 domain-containing membrane protein YozV
MSNALAQKLKDKLPKSEPKGPAAKQVRLKLVYIDFMSALKMSFLLGLAQFIVVVIGTFLLYLVFVQTGIFNTANSVAGEVLGNNSFDINSIASMGKTVGAAAAVGVVNMIVITVMGAICAVLYNAAAKITGGLSVGFTNQQ